MISKSISLFTLLLLAVEIFSQNFSPSIVDPFNTNLPLKWNSKSELIDIDNDGDLDLFVESNANGSIYPVLCFQENIGTKYNPIFDTIKFDPFGISRLPNRSEFNFIDLDGDDDFDLISFTIGTSSSGSSFFVEYFKNIGTSNHPQFIRDTNTFGITHDDRFWSHFFVDIDGDDDMDLFKMKNDGFELQENIGSSNHPNFDSNTTPIYIKQNEFNFYSSMSLGDIDLDGDLDLFCSGYNHDDIFFYENIGDKYNPNFTSQITNPFGLTPKHDGHYLNLSDIDNDGDLDLLTINKYPVASKVEYFQNNMAINNISENEKNINFVIYPNPIKDQVFISTESSLYNKRFDIFNAQGQLILSDRLSNTGNLINLSTQSNGQYFINIKIGDKNVSKSIIKSN